MVGNTNLFVIGVLCINVEDGGIQDGNYSSYGKRTA